MIKPIGISFGIKRKDIIQTVNENNIRKEELRQAKMNATYMFINGKLEIIPSENTDIFIRTKQEYDEWLNEEL